VHKFPSVEQFRHVVRHVRDNASFHSVQSPVIEYVGTVKLHGTNAGISQTNDMISYLSRNRTLAVGDDNAGFVAAMVMEENAAGVDHIFADLRTNFEIPSETTVQIFGEWCGQGIQKGVAVASLPKMYVIFSVYIGDEWHSPDVIPTITDDSVIYRITDFPTYATTIDFNSPELSQNDMVEITMDVEAKCPVGAKFGVEGIGEGVVWTPKQRSGMLTETLRSTPDLWFKVKGEKHSVTKVSKLASVDVERIQGRDALVDALATGNRMEQGIQLHKEAGLTLDMKNIGSYLRWVFADIVKEESDTITASGFEVKEMGKPISDVAKRYYIKAMDAELTA